MIFLAETILPMFLKTDPPQSVLRIRLDARVEQHPRTLDVTDLGIVFQDDAFQRRQIPFGVNRRGCTIAGGGTRNLERGKMGSRTKNLEGSTWSSLRERILSRA